jgi:hypothetical protein
MAGQRIRVGPGIQSTHDVSFNDGVRIYGLALDGGPKGMQEGSSVASSLLANRQGARFGDNDPTFSHVEQRTWVGGRAQENLSDDPSKFFDASCWTLSPNVLLPALLARYAQGLRTAYSQMQGDVTWKPILGATSRAARTFEALTASGVTVRHLYAHLRKIGSPGDITLGVYGDDNGAPNFADPKATATITSQSITDTASFLGEFVFSADLTLTNATDYWIIASQSTGTPSGPHHWEIGYDDSAAGYGYDSADSGWDAYDGFGIYYRLTDADVNRTFLPFVIDGAHYFVTKVDGRTASQVYLAGDRGIVAAGATKTAITCTGKSWVVNQWANARLRICIGPGKGHTAKILSNTADTLTLGSGLHVTPTAANHFVIYQTPYVTLLAPTGGVTIGAVKSVAVANDIAFFASGIEAGDAVIQQFAYHSTDGTHKMDADAAAKADVVYSFYGSGAAKLWRAQNGETTKTVGVSEAAIPTYGNNLSFGTNIPVGDNSWLITNLIDHNGVLYVLKEDSDWYIQDGKAIRVNVGLDRIAEMTNGAAAASQDNYLYQSWSHSVERLAGGTMDDEGPWQGAGMPEDRAGYVSWLEPIVGHMLYAINAGGDGYSSVLAYNGMGFGEVYRATSTGKRIRMTHWQTNPEGRHYLWTEVGGDLVYQVFPKNTLNPLRDASCEYSHESYLVSATIDLDVALLPKFFKALGVVSENLGSSGGLRRVAVDYQMDSDVNTTFWIALGAMAASPEDTKEINQGNKRQIRWRVRLLTEIATSPAKVRAVVMSGYAKVPPKRVWTMRIKLSTLARDTLGAPATDPTELYKWLWQSSKEAGGIFMHTKFENADGIWVVVEPPGLVRNMVNVVQKWWGGIGTLTVREA